MSPSAATAAELTVNSGTTTLANSSTVTGNVTVNNGTLTANGLLNGARLQVNNSGVVDLHVSGNLATGFAEVNNNGQLTVAGRVGG